MGGRGNVVRQAHFTNHADATQSHCVLAVLRGFLSVGIGEIAIRLGDRTEIFFDEREGLGFLELSSDDQDHVVGLVKLSVEGLQIFDWHALDIGTVADGRFPIVVPFVGCGANSLAQNCGRAVLTALELVADDGHFRNQVVALDETVDQPVGLDRDAKLEIFVVRWHRLEIIRAVVVRGSVKARAVIAQCLGN